MNNEFIHSVTLDRDKCMGCINCIKRCPTQAIRVREGKAAINPLRCIDCDTREYQTMRSTLLDGAIQSIRCLLPVCVPCLNLLEVLM